MYWEWKAGRLRLRPIHPDDPQVTLVDSEHSTAATIRRMDIAQSSRILGVHLPLLEVIQIRSGFVRQKLITMHLNFIHRSLQQLISGFFTVPFTHLP